MREAGGTALKAFGVTEAVAAELRRDRNRLILLLGESDTGKTSLLEAVCALMGPDGAAVADLDAGQSRIGPPTTIAWGRAPSQGFSWDRIEVAGLYFTGTTSPVGNLLPTLTGSALIAAAAGAAAPKVLIDTSGLIRGPGLALKSAKIDLLKPDMILALARGRELEPILGPLKAQKRPRVIRLTVPRAVKDKTPAERAAWRQAQFARYFSKAKPLALNIDVIGMSPVFGMGRAKIANRTALKYRVVGLRDADGADLAIGLVDQVDDVRRRLKILTPLKNGRRVKTVVLGKLRVTPDGRQLAYFR